MDTITNGFMGKVVVQPMQSPSSDEGVSECDYSVSKENLR